MSSAAPNKPRTRAKKTKTAAKSAKPDASGNGRGHLSLVQKRDEIVVRGAREHNLKNITVSIPRDRLVVITGLSGSGKSSLLFDVIFNDGQRRYVESLSSYARQFLQMMQKPDVDSIEGLSPAVAIDQKTTSRNPRSTVGTVTEIYDYLRLLYARVGRPHCPVCSREIAAQSAESIVEQVLALPPDTKFTINAPMVRDRKGEHRDVLEHLRQEGFTRVRVDREERLLEEEIVLDKKFKHTIEVVVDRLVMKDDIRHRVADSVETALDLSDGLVVIQVVDGAETTYSRQFACPEHGTGLPELEPRIFSFNSPHGACPRCAGLGYQQVVDPDLIVPDPSLSIAEGAIAPWSLGSTSGFYKAVVEAIVDDYRIDPHTPWQELPASQRDLFLNGTGRDRIQVSYRNMMGRRRSYSMQFAGIPASLMRRHEDTDSESVKERIESYMSRQPCPECQGARLKPAVLSVTVGELPINRFTALSATDALDFVDKLPEMMTASERLIGERILREITERLAFIHQVGAGYLTLDRAANTLSGGEAQKLRLATQIGSQLTGVIYCLDEPTIGTSARDNARLIEALQRLRDIGNSVLVSEHDPGVIRSADWITELGPGAGEHGGRVVAEGTPAQVARNPNSMTGAFLSGRRKIAVPKRRVPARGELRVVGAREHNLKDIDVSFPIGALSVVTGVSGSGKSTLVSEILYPAVANHLRQARLRPGKHTRIEGADVFDRIIVVDQSPIGRTPRSNPATYTKLFDHIRELFAQTPDSKVRGYKQGRFSFNIAGGRCENCAGSGSLQIEMSFLPDVFIPCEVCGGARYNKETLAVRYKGRTIADTLEMTVEDALEFFSAVPKIHRRLQTLHDVGLDYIKLGQPATQLSGGEAQRVKLASELSKTSHGKSLYLLDEPSVGLSSADLEKLIEVLQRLVNAGNTMVVVEHDLDMIKVADRILDLGPEGGDAGGYVIATGTPEEVAEVSESWTGHFLKPLLA